MAETSQNQTEPDWDAVYRDACKIDAAEHLLTGRSGWGISRIAYKAVLHSLWEAGLLATEPPPFINQAVVDYVNARRSKGGPDAR